MKVLLLFFVFAFSVPSSSFLTTKVIKIAFSPSNIFYSSIDNEYFCYPQTSLGDCDNGDSAKCKGTLVDDFADTYCTIAGVFLGHYNGTLGVTYNYTKKVYLNYPDFVWYSYPYTLTLDYVRIPSQIFLIVLIGIAILIAFLGIGYLTHRTYRAAVYQQVEGGSELTLNE